MHPGRDRQSRLANTLQLAFLVVEDIDPSTGWSDDDLRDAVRQGLLDRARSPRHGKLHGSAEPSELAGTVKLSRIRPFCGRILLDQRLRINDLAVAASGENAAEPLNLTVPCSGHRAGRA